MLMWAVGAVGLTETVVSVKQEERNWSETFKKKKLNLLRFSAKYVNFHTTDNKEDFNPQRVIPDNPVNYTN